MLPIGGVSMLHSIVGMPLRGPRLVELGRTVVNLRHGRALREAIEAVRPDIVHLNERGMLQAAVIARRSGAAVVMHARSVADPRPAWLVRLSRRIIATCGSGTSACALVLALELLGRPAAVYDGAWTEWGGRSDTPVDTGPSTEV